MGRPISWRMVLQAYCASLLLGGVSGCELLPRRESAGRPVGLLRMAAQKGEGVVSKGAEWASEREALPAAAPARELALPEEPGAPRGMIQPVKAETQATPPAADKERPEREPDAPERQPDVPDVPKEMPKALPGRAGKSPDRPKTPPAANSRPEVLPPAANGPRRGGPAANGPGHPQGEGPVLPPLEDPHQRQAPTAMGSVLQLPPGESPVERALELTKKVEWLSEEKKALQLRICALEEAMQAAGKQLTTVTRQVEDASAEVARARKDLQTWTDDLREQYARLRQQEKENQELLKMVIATLEKMLGGDAPAPAKPPAGGT